MVLCVACASSTKGPSETPHLPDPNEMPPAMRTMMADGPCQVRLRLPLEKHRMTASEAPGSRPFMISPGEKLCLAGDSPESVELVDDVSTKDTQRGTWISAEFRVLPKIGSVFVVHNHFNRTLQYRSVIMVGREARRTSVCPVRSNIGSLEHWPYAIDVIAFGDFTPLAPGDRGVCR